MPGSQSGVSILGLAIVLPFVLLLVLAGYDLLHVYQVRVFAQEVSLLTAKLSHSASPDADIPSSAEFFVNPTPGEEESVTQRRRDYWVERTSPENEEYRGVPYYTDKELQVLNLGYGYLSSFSSKISFPIPNRVVDERRLYKRTNCTIDFTIKEILAASIETNHNYSRLVYVECHVPLLVFEILNFVEKPYIELTQSAFAFESGDLNPSSSVVAP
ncbi:MAG: hypothetical protein H6619_01480 [Deltaproteobacteria bacterium]|nr:hypothetical protein [Deltaproteobacteria bacterium]